MDNPNALSGKPKKTFTKFKLFLYALALVGLVWLGIQAYWGYFKFKIWFSGFGTGAFFVVGLIGGFSFFHATHKIYERIKDMKARVEKIGALIVFSLGLLVLNPLTLSLAIWMFTPPSVLNTDDQWFFWGSSLGAGIVLLIERLFAKKPPPKESKP